MLRGAIIIAALFLAGCDSGLKYAEAPDEAPGKGRVDLRGRNVGPDELIGQDGAVFWAQQALANYDRVSEKPDALVVGELGSDTCRFPAPAKGDLVRHVIVEHAVQSAPIFTFSTADVGKRAANYVEYYAASKGRNKKVWSYGASDVMGVANVVVTETAAPVFLVLSAESNIVWNILPAAGARISGVALIGSGSVGVANAPAGVEVKALSGARLASCRSPNPMRMPQEDWGFVRNAKNSGGSIMEEALAKNRRYANDYNRWLNQAFGPSTYSSTIEKQGASNFIIGPMPKDQAARVPYKPITAATVLVSQVDYRLVGALADYVKAHDAIVIEAARTAAGGDLERLAAGVKS